MWVGGTDGALTCTPRKTERLCWEPMRVADGLLDKRGVSSWGTEGPRPVQGLGKTTALHGNRAPSVAGELKGLHAKQGQIITQRNKFLQTLRNQVIAQWFVRCSGTCRLRFESRMQHNFFGLIL